MESAETADTGTGIDPSVFFVLVPDEFGELTVIDLQSLDAGLDEFPTLADVLTNRGIDTIAVDEEKIAKVRALNDTGDAIAYWGL